MNEKATNLSDAKKQIKPANKELHWVDIVNRKRVVESSSDIKELGHMLWDVRMDWIESGQSTKFQNRLFTIITNKTQLNNLKTKSEPTNNISIAFYIIIDDSPQKKIHAIKCNDASGTYEIFADNLCEKFTNYLKNTTQARTSNKLTLKLELSQGIDDSFEIGSVLIEPRKGLASVLERESSIITTNKAMTFSNYERFIDDALVGKKNENQVTDLNEKYGLDTYNVVHKCTRLFLQLCSPYKNKKSSIPTFIAPSNDIETNNRIQSLVENSSFSTNITIDEIHEQNSENIPTFELIWVYWMELAMLDQGMKLIGRRFQILKTPNARNKMENFEISSLRPLSNLIWGFINHESTRISLNQRILEYQHQYGLVIGGKAVKKMDAIDVRSEFLKTFHSFIFTIHQYYKEGLNTQVNPNAFPVKYCFDDMQRVLQAGAHNQFSDLTLASRCDFLTTQWILSRPEVKQFINSREEVRYQEPWMEPFSAIRNLQGWGGNLTLYYEAAVRSERILVGLRHANSITSSEGSELETSVKIWAQSYKEDIMVYTHAYKSLTGVDLSQVIDTKQPAEYIEKIHASSTLPKMEPLKRS